MEAPREFTRELDELLKKFQFEMHTDHHGDLNLISEKTGRLVGWWPGSITSKNFQEVV